MPDADTESRGQARTEAEAEADAEGDGEDTADLPLPPDLAGAPAGYGPVGVDRAPGAADPLDGVADWGPINTAAGVLRLVPVLPARDLSLVTTWMNDPVIDAFWLLAGPPERTAAHLERQLTGGGRSVPCLGVLDGLPMSYWEIYRADLDPLARHYPSRLHDTGIHVLIGNAEDRGRGVGAALLRAVAELVLRHRPRCPRVVAEPDVRNVASLAAFRAAGFRKAGEVALPEKRAALMLRDR